MMAFSTGIAKYHSLNTNTSVVFQQLLFLKFQLSVSEYRLYSVLWCMLGQNPEGAFLFKAYMLHFQPGNGFNVFLYIVFISLCFDQSKTIRVFSHYLLFLVSTWPLNIQKLSSEWFVGEEYRNNQWIYYC